MNSSLTLYTDSELAMRQRQLLTFLLFFKLTALGFGTVFLIFSVVLKNLSMATIVAAAARVADAPGAIITATRIGTAVTMTENTPVPPTFECSPGTATVITSDYHLLFTPFIISPFL